MHGATQSSMKGRIPFRVRPILATLVKEPFHRDGWIYEEKYDGDRILACKEGSHVQLLSRNAVDRTNSFPRISAAILALRHKTLLLGGEVVIFDHRGVSRFQLLQKREGEPVYAVFDCLYRDGRDLRQACLSDRRLITGKSIGSNKFLLHSRKLAENGLEAYQTAKKCGFEGLVAKDLASTYVERRSKCWLKVKVHQEDEFLIVGFTQPSGSREYFGALLLGAYDKHGNLHYAGKVGTGFSQESLGELYSKLRPL